MDSEGPLRSSSRGKFAVNGHNRGGKGPTAVVGLALLLMGTSLLRCHAGPRLFSKKDHHDDQTAKKEPVDKSKFINKKRVRPEADYLHDNSPDDKRVAKSNSKTKSIGTESRRPRAADETSRSVATRRHA